MIASSRQESYNAAMNSLDGMLYFVSDGGTILSSVDVDSAGYPIDPEALTSQRAWIVIDSKNELHSNPPGIGGSGAYVPMGTQLYLAWPDKLLTQYEDWYREAIQIVWLYFGSAIALAVLALVFLIMSIVNTGRKRPAYENTRKLWKCDKIFVEFQAILLFITIAIWVNGWYLVLNNYGGSTWGSKPEFYIALGGVSVFVIVAVSLWFILSLIRLGKAGLFAERSLLVMLITGPCMKLGDAIKSGYDGRNPLAKTIIVIVIFWFVTSMFAGIMGLAVMSGNNGVGLIAFILLILVLIGALHFTYKWVARYGRLRKGVEEISSGNVGYKIEIDGDTRKDMTGERTARGKNEFDRLSAMVNDLGSAQNTAFQNELKNQRLKTDLISNVSHDLKTPLTSILTYTDLLKTEGLKSKNAEEYLNIIDEKGRRLQKLTEDLFDAATASSGALNVRKERVDRLALINQEIAEANGSFADAGLELIINAPNEHYYVEADSQLLWRVVDNLINNARKYSQPGTRIYVELKEHARAKAGPEPPLMTIMEIKNTSASKLNIPPDELMERFKRGDEARATEGSGLGLAIAKDLIRLQGGWFEIFIDGDLFKTVVMLPPYTADPYGEDAKGPAPL
jgi:signal transduction histidine kinase